MFKTNSVLVTLYCLEFSVWNLLFPKFYKQKFSVVGPGRLELPTSALSGLRSNQLSYRPPNPSCELASNELNSIAN